MLPESNTPTRGSKYSLHKHEITLCVSCLLCRVLWPRILPHRHIPAEASSEAKTLYRSRSR